MSKVLFSFLFISSIILVSCQKQSVRELRVEIKKIEKQITKTQNDIKLLETRLSAAQGETKTDIKLKIDDFKIRLNKLIDKKTDTKNKIKNYFRKNKNEK